MKEILLTEKEMVFLGLQVHAQIIEIYLPFNFSRNNHRPLGIMDDCNKCCKISTVSLTYGCFKWSREIMTLS